MLKYTLSCVGKCLTDAKVAMLREDAVAAQHHLSLARAFACAIPSDAVKYRAMRAYIVQAIEALP